VEEEVVPVETVEVVVGEKEVEVLEACMILN
jgi:hypothetical protein